MRERFEIWNRGCDFRELSGTIIKFLDVTFNVSAYELSDVTTYKKKYIFSITKRYNIFSKIFVI